MRGNFSCEAAGANAQTEDRPMIKTLAHAALTSALLFPVGTIAEPVKLNFAFFTSDRSLGYASMVKPFVDAVNAKGRDLIQIDVHFSGALGKDPLRQAPMVSDGAVDFAYVIPAMTPARFPENDIIELPGLYRDMREAATVYTRMVAANRLRGYEDYMVIGAFASAPETIHVRTPIASLADLKGLKIRTNNSMEVSQLTRLGMIPMPIPINQVVTAISNGTIDGATIPEAMLIEFGIGRVTTYHYQLKLGSAPLLALMNRKKFESLPKPAQDIIRSYSGQWALERFIEVYGTANDTVLAQLKADPKRSVVMPSAADLNTSKIAARAVIDEFAAQSPRHRELLQFATDELAKLRSGE